MKYNYTKDYKNAHILDDNKKQGEFAVANKIMELLNNNKFDNIDEFINENPTYQDFLKKNKIDIAITHFSKTLTEEDYTKILSQMIKITNKKKSYDKEDIKITTIGNNQYVSHEGDKTRYLDNSNNADSIYNQADKLQTTQEQFQTTDPKKNTENMMEELEETKKESLNFKYLNEYNLDLLNDEEKKIWNAAASYQLSTNQLIRVDIEKEVIINEDEKIMKIEKRDGEIFIEGQTKENTLEEKQKENTYQKKLMPSPNTIYSDNN